MQLDSSFSAPPENQARNCSLFRSGICREEGSWVITQSGARTAMMGSIVQVSQAWTKAVVVLRMAVASWDDMVGSQGRGVVFVLVRSRVR